MAQPTTTHPDPDPATLPAVQSLRGAAAIQQIIAQHVLELADTLGPITADEIHTSLSYGVWAIDLPTADQARALASRLGLSRRIGVGGPLRQVWTGSYADHRIRISGSGRPTSPADLAPVPDPRPFTEPLAPPVSAGVTARWTVTAPVIPAGHGLCFSCGLIVRGVEATSPCEACAATSRRLAAEEAGSDEVTFEQLVHGGQR